MNDDLRASIKKLITDAQAVLAKDKQVRGLIKDLDADTVKKIMDPLFDELGESVLAVAEELESSE